MTAGTAAVAERRSNYAEQKLFDISPFNLWITMAALYGLIIGAYALAASLSGASWISQTPTGPELEPGARAALVLSLLICMILGQQRFSRLKEEADAPNFALALRPGATWAPTFSKARLRTFTIIGAVVGAVIVGLLIRTGPGAFPSPLALWFGVISILLSVMFFRGLELTGAAARHTRQVIRDDLRIDLLNIERLYPWGRAAARTSMVWFLVSAVILLLFAANGFTLASAAILLGSAAIGVWVFVRTLTLIHQRIRSEKDAELTRLRTEITALVARLDQDPTAPPRLTSLLAYEARIDAIPEWPFDQTILVRLGVSSLILTVPWFGQALASAVVENMSKVAH